VERELQLQKCPLPSGLILALIDRESSGVPGIVNAKSGAAGLMQVMPIALDSYNKTHAQKFAPADLQDRVNGIAQIRIGVWVLGQFWRAAHGWLSTKLAAVPIDELARFADLFYAAGPKTIVTLGNKLASLSYAAFASAYPKLAVHPTEIFSRFDPANIDSTSVATWISSSARSSAVRAPDAGAGGAQQTNWVMLTVLGAAIGWGVKWFLDNWKAGKNVDKEEAE
jgi:hypothetical protein